MTYKIVGTIDVGSYALELKIFEISRKKGIVLLSRAHHVIELGKDTYTYGKISDVHIHELCEILYDFTKIMKEYQVEDYVAYATSAVREATNRAMVLDRIKVKTGLIVKVLSNSEQRFVNYKAVAVKPEFMNMIQEETAVIGVGAGSIQISLFDKQVMITTQNIKLGSLRIRELLLSLSNDREHFNRLIEELINNDIATFKRMFLKERKVKNIVAVGDYIGYFTKKNNKQIETMSREQFLERYQNLMEKNVYQLSDKLHITEEQASLLMPCILIYKRMIEETDTETIWYPQFDLCEGMIAEYGFQHGLLKLEHDFREDILHTARVIAKRYRANIKHTQILEENALVLFDAMKKYHGFGERERLLLQLAAILHDCGKYISMSQPAQASYNIIMSTEIIGISHNERELIANIVRYNTEDIFEDYDEKHSQGDMYLKIIKLVALLRVANAMDRSHKQKFSNTKAFVIEGELVITTYTREDITLERGLFQNKAAFFEEVYGIKPVLRQNKEIRRKE